MTDIPPTRQLKKLSEICVIERGGSPRPIEDFLTNEKNGVNWIKIGDTKNITKYITHTQEKIKSEGVKRSRMVYPGDFVLSNSMSFGKPYIMQITGCIHDGRLVLRPDKTIDKDFMYHLLGSPFMYAKFEQTAAGTGVKNLNIQKVKEIEIPLPSLPTQHAIVTRLDEASATIQAGKSAIQDQIDALDMLWQSSLSSIMNNNIGELVKLGTLCDFVRGPFGGSLKKEIFKPSGYAIYEQQHAIYNQFDEIRYFIDESKFNEMKRFELKEGDLIMSCSGTMGKIAIVPNGIKKGIINQALLKLTPSKKIYNKFLKLLMQSESFQNGLNEFSQGAAIQNVASVAILKQIQIPLPPLPEQQQIVSDLDELSQTINNLKTLYKSQHTEYDALRASILDKAFRGELVS